MPSDALPPLVWLFVDMNSFFASVEQHLRPELRGRPVGVVPVLSDGSCVIAASHEAKARGVKNIMGVRDARKICPDITFAQARPAEYVRVHDAIAASIDKHAPIHRTYSIDEWAIRLCSAEQTPEAALDLGRRIKAQIRTDHSEFVTCSVGIAPTRLLAKIASDLKKPDGLTLLNINALPDRLEHVSLSDLCGIGRGMTVRLEKTGIKTAGDLWALSRREAIAIWGSIAGGYWWAGFHGIDEPEITTHRHSMSHANVLEPRLRNDTGARAMLIRLVCRLGSRLRSDRCVAGSLGIQVAYTGGGRFADALDLPAVQDTPSLLESLYTLWERRPTTTAAPMQVTAFVSGLVPSSQVAGHLFAQAYRDERLSHTMDAITQRWGASSLYVGSMHECCQHMDDKIAFCRIPRPLNKVSRNDLRAMVKQYL